MIFATHHLTDPSFLFRLKQCKHSGEHLIRACGLTKIKDAHVVDACGGFGEDGMLLAVFAKKVTMFERHEHVFDTLNEALHDARKHPDTSSIARRISLWYEDAIEALTWIKEPVDIIYIDPIFPESKKSALNKEKMRQLKQIVGDDLDAHELLDSALRVALRRVVVKRPRKAPPIFSPYQKPSYSISGKSNRFDVYVIA